MVAPSLSSIDYTPAGQDHAGQEMDLYIPDGPTPIGGWPVLVCPQAPGLTASSTGASLTSGVEYVALQNGFAVAMVAVSVLATALGGSGGAPTGGGMWLNPLDSNYDVDGGVGYWPCSNLDVKWAVQKARSLANELGLNTRRFAGYGRSGGGHVAAEAVFGEDIADPDNAVPMRRHSSKLHAFLHWQPTISYWPGVAQTTAVATIPNPYLRAEADPATPCGDTNAAADADVLAASPCVNAAHERNAHVPMFQVILGSPNDGVVGDNDFTIDWDPQTGLGTKLPNMVGTDLTGWASLHATAYGIVLGQTLYAHDPQYHRDHSPNASSTAWSVETASHVDGVFAPSYIYGADVDALMQRNAEWLLRVLPQEPSGKKLVIF